MQNWTTALLAKINVTIKKAKKNLKIKVKTTGIEVTMASKLSKLEVPRSVGNYTVYKYFKIQFQMLADSWDKMTQKIFLAESLKGRAYECVEDVVKQDGEVDDIWKQLNAHFGNEYHTICATIKAFFELPKPTKYISL